MIFSTLHKKFLEECKKLKIQDYEYPFNTKSKGYVSLISYIKTLEAVENSERINRENKNAIQKFYSTGFGHKYSTNPIAPYSVVQLDGHKIDMLYSVEVENKNGDVVRMQQQDYG